MNASPRLIRPVHDSRLALNSILNLLGQGVPLVAALFAIPRLIHGLGTERFGLLTLGWLVIGYFSLFDFGMARALTQVIAAQRSSPHDAEAPALVYPALAMMGGLGMVGATVLIAIAPWIVRISAAVPVALRAEVLPSVYVLAIGIPVVVITSGFVGILTAYNRFGVLNAIRAPMGIYMFLAPIAVLPFSRSLILIFAVLVFGRLLACAAYFAYCVPLLPSVHVVGSWRISTIKPLFQFGAWMTVTNVVGPLLLYLDRFVIGAVVSAAAVAYYATPYEMLTKILIIPAAVLGVLFPAFATTYQNDHDAMVRLFLQGVKFIALTVFPILLVVVTFGREGLNWWLGADFARQSTPVLEVLAVGVFINCLAQVFFSLVQAVGRPDLTAKLHLLELPIYVPMLWVAAHRFGIVGAAVAWTARVALDAILLAVMAFRFLGDSGALMRRMAASLLAAVAALVLPAAIPQLETRALVGMICLVAFIGIGWFQVLGHDERVSLSRRVRRQWAS